MIQQIWEKKIVAIIEMSQEDVADETPPLPLFLALSWNHYIGFYYEKIIQFFMPNIPFPFKKQEFWVQLPERKTYFDGTQIISQLIHIHKLDIEEQPIHMICHFRSRFPLPKLDLKRFYKNNLKASTAIRYGKKGASILTVQMSINNVEEMFTNFKQDNFLKYLGSSDFNSDQLGFRFLIHRGQNIPVRVISKDFTLERSVPSSCQIKTFFVELFTEEIVENLKIKLHEVEIGKYTCTMKDLEQYCHPDGFLYFHI